MPMPILVLASSLHPMELVERLSAFDATDLAESFGGQLLYALVPPRADGSTHLVLDPLELIEKLAAYSGDRGAS
jgi:hypothetical protein